MEAELGHQEPGTLAQIANNKNLGRVPDSSEPDRSPVPRNPESGVGSVPRNPEPIVPCLKIK